MREKNKKYQQTLVILLMAVCMVIIMAGGIQYVRKLRNNLQDNEIQSLMAVTVQQQQAFDTFIAEDQESLQDFAEFFKRDGITASEVQQLLPQTNDQDVIYLVICLDEGWVCGTSFDDIRQLKEEDLELYRSLSDSGVRDTYTGLYSGTSRFGYYKTFSFSSGHKGLIQKSYDRNKVFEKFSLSFYNDQGFTYVVNQQGDILLQPAGATENLYDNIFDVMIENQGQQEDVARFMEELQVQKNGSMVIAGNEREFIYTYVPSEKVNGWYLVSFVAADTITEDTEQILWEFQMALCLLILLLFICALCILLIWRKQKDFLLKDKEAKYHEKLFNIFATYLANSTDDVYLMLDHKTGKAEYISPNVERVLGVKAEEVLDFAKQGDLNADAETARAYYTALKALKPGEMLEQRNTERINPKTGEHKFFVENAYCVEIEGQCKRVCYISDRTKERKVENNLVEALRMARAANDAKSAFLGNMSHDIRTPMNAIIGFLALMRDEVDKPEVVMEYNRRIDAASKHLLELINDVLDMNKIESGSAVLNISEINLADIIEEVNNIIRPQAKDKKQTFHICVSDLRYECVMGDKLRINQILLNLLSNAVKYTQEGGAIQMRVEELPQVVDDYSRICFTISDNGPGMSEEYLNVIFEPFTREETSGSLKAEGTGLGMAITKSLVDMMGGNIRVESEPDKGTVFTVELELCIRKQEEDENAEFWAKHQINRVLVADDKAENCRNIVKALSQAGMDAEHAAGRGEAMEMMRRAKEAGKPYDLILLDWKMLEPEGLETVRLIQEEYEEKPPVLLFTAEDWHEIEKDTGKIGREHFIPKPFFMSMFKEAVSLISGSREKEETGQKDVVQGRHILVVDDIEVNRMILVKILSTLGASCDIAVNGQEAVEKFEASAPGEYDLIIMDIQMPVMDGYTATKTIREGGHPLAKTIPIIAMSANAFVEDVRSAMESGMNAHIAKPVQIDKLKATMEQVLGG